MMKQLIVTGLMKTFGQGDNIVHALLDVNLSVEKGEFLAIMGASDGDDLLPDLQIGTIGLLYKSHTFNS